MYKSETLIHGLLFSRGFTNMLLNDFQTTEDWLSRPHDRANHAMWFTGHIGLTDNSVIGMLDPAQADRRPEFGDLFGRGSTPSDDPSDYPTPKEIRAWMEDRRNVLIKIIEMLAEEDFSQPTPPSAPDFLQTIGQALQFLPWHEGMHSGQVTVPHRALGHSPLADRPQQEAANA